MIKKITKSYYGSTIMLKVYCKACKRESFVIDGELSCCNAIIVDDFEREHKKREIQTEFVRSRIKKNVKENILDKQDGKCIYCELDLRQPFYFDPKHKKYRKMRIHFDHFVAWVYSGDNSKENLYASCPICNLIKSDKHFVDIATAKDYILEERRKRNKSNLNE